MRGRLWPPHENELDARFSFPDRRHSFYSEVYPGVRVLSCLIFCPSSLPILRSVSRSVSCFPPFSANCLSVDECWAVSPATKYRALQPPRLSRHNTIPRTSASSNHPRLFLDIPGQYKSTYEERDVAIDTGTITSHHTPTNFSISK